MYVFVSHSSKDNEITKKVTKVLEEYNIKHWVDNKEIERSSTIDKEIENAIEKCSHVFLLWSENAKKSEGVDNEIRLINDSPNKNKIEKINFRIDNTQLPSGFAGKNYDRISISNVEKFVKESIEMIKPSFREQIKEFKNKVSFDYNNWSNKDYNPTIKNFKKFDVKNLYVSQDFGQYEKNKGHIIREQKKPIVGKIEAKREIIRTKGYAYEKIIKTTKKDGNIITQEIILAKTTKKDISGNVKKLLKNKKTSIIPIVADYGSGKSALTHNILYDLCDENQTKIPIFIPLGNLEKKEGGYEFEEFKNAIFKFIREKYDFIILKEEFENIIKNEECVFIFDALDEMSIKIEDKVAQKNLEQMIKLSNNGKNKILVTSRKSYMSGIHEIELLRHEKIIHLQDFEFTIQVPEFIHKKIPNNISSSKIITSLIMKHNIEYLAKKPLFLNIICEEFQRSGEDIFSDDGIVNESVIFKKLTDSWLDHDLKSKERSEHESEESYKKEIERKRSIRQECSEILAVEQHRTGDIEAIKQENLIDIIKDKIKKQNPKNSELEAFLKDARDSTFLTVEGNDSFRFILKPILEYFLAKIIVKHIENKDIDNLIYSVGNGISAETYVFIKSILDIKWAVKPHIFNSKEIKNKENKEWEKYEDKRDNIVKMLDIARSENYKDNVKILVEILHITNNLEIIKNLSKLNLEGVNLMNARLNGVDFQKSNLSNANFTNAILEKSDFRNTELIDAIFEGANLQEAKLRDAKFRTPTIETFPEYAELTSSNTKKDEEKFIRANLRRADLAKAELNEVNLNGADLRGANFERGYGTEMVTINLNDTLLQGANFSGANLSNAYIRNAKVDGANFREANLQGAHTEGTDMSIVTK